MTCEACKDTGRRMVEWKIDGGLRLQFVDCECKPKEESRRSPRWGAMINIRHGMKGDMHDYRDDLARFPGDPQAHIDGPRALQKLKDQRQREGWRFHNNFSDTLSEAPDGPAEKTGEEMAREAYRRAAASNFDTGEE